MKSIRLTLAGVLAIFVLFNLQSLARAASAIPRLGVHFCFSSEDAGDSFSLRQLDFGDRVTYQRAIEEVYWRHRIWPTSRPDPKPSIDAVISQAAIEQKVQDYLRSSDSLEEAWQKPITPEQLQAEMERMAQHTKQPEVLRELFAALGNDPFVIAECLARPVLSERLVTNSRTDEQDSLGSWSAGEALEQIPKVIAVATTNNILPAIADQPSECVDDSWTATSTTNAPTARFSHTAVWTGSEMIVWGGSFLNTGGRYNPSTDSWTATRTTNAPTGRQYHTALWTGTEMIVWGGQATGYTNTGGRYNPSTDTWTATNTTSAPTGRAFHPAVWTGSEMIVWGGFDNNGSSLNTGGRYNPTTDSWTATTTSGAPIGRYAHTAVWTDSEMAVWGGTGSSGALNTGGRYDPVTDSWVATSTTNAPTGRYAHTTVWTGAEMIIWGGNDGGSSYLESGGRYDPDTNTWTATNNINAPGARSGHTAVWTGNEMILWGGADIVGPLKSGGKYNPITDSWTGTTSINAPTLRKYHTAVWTDSQMIVWGGYDDSTSLNTGGKYCAQGGAPITLDAHIHRQGGKRWVVLTWSPADGGSVNVLRNGVVVHSTDDDGFAEDKLGIRTGTFFYQVCETDSGECSNQVRVVVRDTVD